MDFLIYNEKCLWLIKTGISKFHSHVHSFQPFFCHCSHIKTCFCSEKIDLVSHMESTNGKNRRAEVDYCSFWSWTGTTVSLPAPNSTARKANTLKLANLKWEVECEQPPDCVTLRQRGLRRAPVKCQPARPAHAPVLLPSCSRGNLLVPSRSCSRVYKWLLRNARIDCGSTASGPSVPLPSEAWTHWECNRCGNLELGVNLLCSVHRLL